MYRCRQLKQASAETAIVVLSGRFLHIRAGLYNTVFGQCTEGLQAKLKSHPEFRAADQNGIELLALIKELTYTFEERSKLSDALCDVKEYFYTFKQGKYMSLQRYYELFLSHVEVMEQVGITIEDESFVEAIAVSNLRQVPNEDDRRSAREQTLAIRFIRGTNDRYKSYLTHLRNTFLDGSDMYPETLDQAYNILQRREPDNMVIEQQGDGMTFANVGEQNNSSGNGKNKDHVICYDCGDVGHYANKCPKMLPAQPTGTASETKDGKDDQNGGNGGRNQQGTNCCTVGIVGEEVTGENKQEYSFYQSGGKHIPNTWILLDNQSTIDIFCNRSLLENIRTSSGSMTVHYNAGRRTTNLVGDLPGYGTVWYDPEAIANILSLKRVKEKYHVVYDSTVNGVFTVTRPDGETFEFCESDRGLYYMDTKLSNGTVLVTTVNDRKQYYTNEDYQRAVVARELQIKIGRPSYKDYIKIVENKMLVNCPVTRADIDAAEDIFGPDVGSLKGKTVRKKPAAVRNVVTKLPVTILERYRNVTLCVDIMYICGIPMLVSVSRNIKFGTVEDIPNRLAKNLLLGIKKIIKLYRRAGFKVEAVLMDGEFEVLRDDLAEIGVSLNTAAPDKHVGDIERYICTIKERIRGIYNTLPFGRKLPQRIITEMAKHSVFWLNSFPSENGVSTSMIPRTIITGQMVDFNKHCRFQFGEYVQTHEQHDNSMVPRTIGALAMRPTGNTQGSFYFYSLSTGRIINRRHATKLPMSAEVIERVQLLSAKQHHVADDLIFGDRNNNLLEDDREGNNGEAFGEAFVENLVEIEPVLEDEDVEEMDDDEDFQLDNIQPRVNIIDNVTAHQDNMNNVHHNLAEIAGVDGAIAGVDDEIIEVEDDIDVLPYDDVVDVEEEMNARYGERNHEYNLRPRRARTYDHLFVNDGTEDTADAPLATSQMGMTQGIKLFGEAGTAAVKSELKQLHDRRVMTPVLASSLTKEQRLAALAYLMFLKRKRCGKVKARGCADGRKQRKYIRPEDAASPTVSTEAIFMTALIDAYEKREVAVMDVPGAFMQADMDETVHVRFTDKMVELLLEIDPDLYGPYVIMEGKVKVLYVLLLKALYGTIRAARLFWEKLTRKLQEWGFTVNPYDACVMNKLVNGKQLTVTWLVDDLKVSHVDKLVVDNFVHDMNLEFGQETPMNESRGSVHDYLGMTLDYSNPGCVRIDMSEYVKMVLHDIPDKFVGVANTPAALHLYEVNEEAEKLNSDDKAQFVHYVMQLLYLSQRGRPDIRTAISFLCTRLQQPDVDDYKKLIRVLTYLQGTIDLVLTLATDEGGFNIRWWVDAAYAVHSNMRGHTGGTMMMGTGSVYSTSSKQKMVGRCSTECEIIGVYDVLPQMTITSNVGHKRDLI